MKSSFFSPTPIDCNFCWCWLSSVFCAMSLSLWCHSLNEIPFRFYLFDSFEKFLQSFAKRNDYWNIFQSNFHIRFFLTFEKRFKEEFYFAQQTFDCNLRCYRDFNVLKWGVSGLLPYIHTHVAMANIKKYFESHFTSNRVKGENGWMKAIEKWTILRRMWMKFHETCWWGKSHSFCYSLRLSSLFFTCWDLACLQYV